MNIQMQNANTYHLDQNVRGRVSRKNDKIGQRIRDRVSTRYPNEKHEAILPFALLEYAGISQQTLFKSIRRIPNKIHPMNTEEIEIFLKNELKKKLPESTIKQRLKDNLKYSNEYAKPFLKGCIDILPKTYDLIIDQLSWDRLSYLEWIKDVSSNVSLDITKQKLIREQIARLLCKKPYLYVLRHCRHIQPLLLPEEKEQEKLNELGNSFLKVIKEMTLKPNQDIGDCELIHTAIHGQSSIQFTQVKIVDCYTMDNPDEIKRRLIMCLFFYECLKQSSFRDKLNMEYSGKIYILDQQTGEEKEEIIVKDYVYKEMWKKIKNQDSQIMPIIFS